jgi:hypothetical protein
MGYNVHYNPSTGKVAYTADTGKVQVVGDTPAFDCILCEDSTILFTPNVSCVCGYQLTSPRTSLSIAPASVAAYEAEVNETKTLTRVSDCKWSRTDDVSALNIIYNQYSGSGCSTLSSSSSIDSITYYVDYGNIYSSCSMANLKFQIKDLLNKKK